MPVCLGHEVVGVVEALGKGVTTDRAGTPLTRDDRVYWSPSNPCGECWMCRKAHNPASCEGLSWPAPASRPNAAGFRELATVGPRCTLYRIPDEASFESVIAFSCAMPTAIAGFARLRPVPDHVVIQGAGPVGLASTLLASLGGARNIIVFGDPRDRLTAARRLGATHVISVTGTTPQVRREMVLSITEGRGAQAIVEAAGRVQAFPEGLDLLGMNGRYLILGLYSGSQVIAVNPVRINNLNLRVKGSIGMPREEFLRTVEIAAEHGERLGFADLITHRFPLNHTEEAIRTVANALSVKTVVAPS